jgi:hypothetical protein
MHICICWLQVMAVNGLSERVSVVHRDVALLQRGREVRPLGCNLAIADLFDAGGPSTPFKTPGLSRAQWMLILCSR